MLELPTTFGKYFLTEKLATGGMAEIYLAKIVGPGGFEKQLVLKQIHPKLTGQRHFVDLFVAEAKTLVTLTHGNIVPVYELGVVDDTYFIAMEYIDGPTLYRLTETLQRRGAQMAPPVAAWITGRILEGLDYAHRKGEGVIHRDLSPRNVMLSRDGEVKLVDFGIAVTLGAGADDGSQSAPTGSFPYMSPEQVRREPLTGQTDLFSVGVLCWEMLVGRRLFARDDPDATLAAVTGADIPAPSSLRPEVPARLDDVVMRALERTQRTRCADAAEMLAAIQKYLYALDDTPGPRDVAALVARYCPPETRRMPTHAEADGLSTVTHEGAPAASPAPDDAQGTPPPAGPRTAVLPRDGAARGRLPRAPTRQQSFATNVDFGDLLERGDAAAAADAPPDARPHDAAKGPSTVVVPRRVEGSDAKADEPARDATDAPAGSTLRVRAERGDFTRGPASWLLVAAGFGMIALTIAAVYVFVRGRDAVLASDAAPIATDAGALDATAGMVDDAAEPTLPDVQLDAAPATIVAIDAAVRAAADAAPPPRDAAPLPIDANAIVRPAGIATLKIGADPWGEVLVDGVRKGRAPLTLQVTAGKHVVEVVFAGEDPPRKKSFPIEVSADATQDVFADFTKP